MIEIKLEDVEHPHIEVEENYAKIVFSTRACPKFIGKLKPLTTKETDGKSFDITIKERGE